MILRWYFGQSHRPVLEHVDVFRTALEEMYRFLHPEGSFIFIPHGSERGDAPEDDVNHWNRTMT